MLNNKILRLFIKTTAAALELIYTDPAWPSNVPSLNVSLRESGKSRADLWQYAANIALEVEIERANFGCDYDFNTGNQVRLLEGVEECFFKLFKPSVFKFGRRDSAGSQVMMRGRIAAQVRTEPNFVQTISPKILSVSVSQY